MRTYSDQVSTVSYSLSANGLSEPVGWACESGEGGRKRELVPEVDKP